MKKPQNTRAAKQIFFLCTLGVLTIFLGGCRGDKPAAVNGQPTSASSTASITVNPGQEGQNATSGSNGAASDSAAGSSNAPASKFVQNGLTVEGGNISPNFEVKKGGGSTLGGATSAGATTSSGASADSSTGATSATDGSKSPTAVQGIKGIAITANGFTPASLPITPGTKVVFYNTDDKDHWPASDPHPAHTDCPGFDAKKALKKGESYEFTFDKAETCSFHDHLNPSTKGTIVVK